MCLGAALAAGFINSIAGGGTLLSFPALQWSLGSLVAANTTSTVALLPGSLAGAWGAKKYLAGTRTWLCLLIPASILGGALGAALVLEFQSQFALLVPWLLVLASTLFLLQPWLKDPAPPGTPDSLPGKKGLVGLFFFQFIVAIYGGYFGAGIGILMMASLSYMGIHEIHRVNALKNILAFATNTTAALVFAATANIHWPVAGSMAIFSVIGGILGVKLSLKIPRPALRIFIILVGYILAAYFFWKPS